MFAGFLHALGDFSSVSANFARLYPQVEITDDDNKPTGRFIERRTEDQIAVAGTLNSGATVTFHLRTGLSKLKPGRTYFSWIIDGEEGTIEVRGDSAFYTLDQPHTLIINGEEWKPDETETSIAVPLERAWEEFSKGPEEGKYATFEQAYKLHQLVDAIQRSARDGVRVTLD